jgi:Rrf2 family nitric oxide-sensitive transcriptional repressor
MRLTLHTDYSLRVLIYLGSHPERLATITEIAQSYGISRNHLVKVVHNLATIGLIETVRGKGGGMRLGKPPESINIGEVVKKVEGSFELVECFSQSLNRCPITPVCSLKGVLEKARQSFLDVLCQYQLADLLHKKERLVSLLQLRQN